MKLRFVAALACTLAVTESMGFCADSGVDGGFLVTQKVDAVSVSMGEAYTGVVGDLSAIPYNPAGLLGIPGSAYMLSYRQGVSDLKTGGIQFGFGSEWHAFAAGVTGLDAGKADVLDSLGNPVSFSAQQDYLATVTYALAVGKMIALGANLKYLTSRLAEAVSANSISFDAGANYSPGETTTLGFSVLNMGQGMKYLEETDALPLTIRGGISQWMGETLLCVDILQSGKSGLKAHAGIDIAVMKALRLRGGYRMGYDSDTLALGLGFIVKGLTISYSYTFLNQVAPGQVLSISFVP